MDWGDFDCFHPWTHKTEKGLGLLYTTVYHGKKPKSGTHEEEPQAMAHRNTVFAQLTTFLPRSFFEKVVSVVQRRLSRSPVSLLGSIVFHASCTDQRKRQSARPGDQLQCTPVVPLSSGSFRGSPVDSCRCQREQVMADLYAIVLCAAG